jgi:hypothetical protein
LFPSGSVRAAEQGLSSAYQHQCNARGWRMTPVGQSTKIDECLRPLGAFEAPHGVLELQRYLVAMSGPAIRWRSDRFVRSCC